MKKLSFFIAFLFATLPLFYIGCSPNVATRVDIESEKQVPRNARYVNLVWKPTMAAKDLDLEPLAMYKSISIAFLSVNDVRQEPRVIGKTFKDLKVRETIVPLLTRVNIARWCRSALENVCRTLDIQADDKKGTLRLEIEITDFMIDDDFTQTGNVSFRINALAGEDMLIWEGRINGTSDLYVHGTDSDGISECLSNTMMVTFQNVLTDQSFRDAVEKSVQ